MIVVGLHIVLTTEAMPVVAFRPVLEIRAAPYATKRHGKPQPLYKARRRKVVACSTVDGARAFSADEVRRCALIARHSVCRVSGLCHHYRSHW